MFARGIFLILVFAFCGSVFGQGTPGKKNSRPAETGKPEEVPVLSAQAPVYFYDFWKPEFVVSKVHIEHDENGIGRIVFSKKDLDEDLIREIALSQTTIERLKIHWANLNFLKSDSNYQSERDYAHLGTMKLRMKRDELDRSAEFNWTENPDALAITEEYKKISNQYIWIFDIELARRNQPLESPRIMKQLDSYLRRDRISDPPEIVPYLIKMSEDEQFPLITRNHAKRLADSILKRRRTDSSLDELLKRRSL